MARSKARASPGRFPPRAKVARRPAGVNNPAKATSRGPEQDSLEVRRVGPDRRPLSPTWATAWPSVRRETAVLASLRVQDLVQNRLAVACRGKQKARLCGPFAVAGAGFEPATSGL